VVYTRAQASAPRLKKALTLGAELSANVGYEKGDPAGRWTPC
jgi:hypothetical protein